MDEMERCMYRQSPVKTPAIKHNDNFVNESHLFIWVQLGLTLLRPENRLCMPKVAQRGKMWKKKGCFNITKFNL